MNTSSHVVGSKRHTYMLTTRMSVLKQNVGAWDVGIDT